MKLLNWSILPRRLYSLSSISRKPTINCQTYIQPTLRYYSFPPMPHILKKNDIPEADKKQIEEEVAEITKDWSSLGFHETDKHEDLFLYHFLMASFISFFTFGIFFFMWYAPQVGQTDWAKREAFLVLEDRRNKGLPLIDRDLIPASQVSLPPEEDLKPDFKIII